MRIRWRGFELPTRVVAERDSLTDTYGKFIAEDSISYITTGQSGNATAVFTWLPKAGKHNLKFVVDPVTPSRPHGRVLESSEDNNIQLETKQVLGDETIPGLTVPMTMLALLGAVFVAAIIGRRR